MARRRHRITSPNVYKCVYIVENNKLSSVDMVYLTPNDYQFMDKLLSIKEATYNNILPLERIIYITKNRTVGNSYLITQSSFSSFSLCNKMLQTQQLHYLSSGATTR